MSQPFSVHQDESIPLRRWQLRELPLLQGAAFAPSRFAADLTVLVYCFPPEGHEAGFFRWIACSILQTWRCLGVLKTVIVANRAFPEAAAFAAARPSVEIQVEPLLTPGNISTMSYDCIVRLHTRFQTPYCLIIQDDGFPLQSNLSDFLGKWDFIGAPTVRSSRRGIASLLGISALNGGFSLRSRKICLHAAKTWRHFGRFLFSPESRIFAEDNFYTLGSKLSPFYLFRQRIAPPSEAVRFSFDDIGGTEAPPPFTPFGFHGRTTAAHFLS